MCIYLSVTVMIHDYCGGEGVVLMRCCMHSSHKASLSTSCTAAEALVRTVVTWNIVLTLSRHAGVALIAK